MRLSLGWRHRQHFCYRGAAYLLWAMAGDACECAWSALADHFGLGVEMRAGEHVHAATSSRNTVSRLHAELRCDKREFHIADTRNLNARE